MLSPPSSPEYSAQSGSDFEKNNKQKKKTQNVTANKKTTAESSGSNRMSLRETTQHHQPGRYREIQEMPNTKPAWTHHTRPYIPELTGFIGPYSLPMDSPTGYPSRERYEASLREQQEKEQHEREAEQQGIAHVSVNIRAKAQDGSPNGPNIAHLPVSPLIHQDLLQPVIDGDEAAGAAAAYEPGIYLDEKDFVVDHIMLDSAWQQLPRCTQWILIDYQNKKFQSHNQGRGLPDAFRSLGLRLSDIIKFLESYNHEKNLYEKWCTRIKTTQPAQNALEFYGDGVWTSRDLTTYIISDKKILQGQEYLDDMGEKDVDGLMDVKGCHREFFHIEDMQDLDLAFLKQSAQRGIDLEYDALTPESINWILHNSAEGSNNPSEQHYVQQDEPYPPEALNEKAKPNNLDGAMLNNDENGHSLELSTLNAPDLGGLAVESADPFHPKQHSIASCPPVERTEEKFEQVGGDRLTQPASFVSDLRVFNLRPQDQAEAFSQWNPAQLPSPRTRGTLENASSYFKFVDLSNLPPVEFAPFNSNNEPQQAQQDFTHQPFEQQEYIEIPDDGPYDVQQQEEMAVGGASGSAMLHAQMMNHHFSFAHPDNYVGDAGYQVAEHGNANSREEEDASDQQVYMAWPPETARCHGRPDNQFVGNNGLYQELDDCMIDPRLFEDPGPIHHDFDFETVHSMDYEQGIQAVADGILVPELAATINQGLARIGDQDSRPQIPRQEHPDRLSIRTMGSPVSGSQVNSIYQGEQHVMGCASPLANLDSMSDNFQSSPARDPSREHHIVGYENKLQENMEVHRIQHYRKNNDLNPDDMGPAKDLAFDQNVWDREQPVVHGFPCALHPNLDAQNVPYRQNAVISGQPLPDGPAGPRLPGVVNNYHSETGRVPISEPLDPTMNQSPTSHSAVQVPIARASEPTPAQGQVSRTTAATAGPASKRYRLCIVKTPDGRAILRQERVVENHLPDTHRHISSKRARDEDRDDGSDEPVVTAPIGRRQRPHPKETAALDSDEDFKEVGVPICEADDEDYEPEESERPRRNKVSRKGKKTAATHRKKKVDEAVEKIPVKTSKRKNTTRLPPAAALRHVNHAASPTPPVAEGDSAYPLAGINGISGPSNGVTPDAATGVASIPQLVQIAAKEPPVQNRKRKYTTRPKKTEEGEAGELPKPKRARTKKAQTANKEAPALDPIKVKKETPVPLPPMLNFVPGPQEGSVAGNHGVPSNTTAPTPTAAPKRSTKADPKTSAKARGKSVASEMIAQTKLQPQAESIPAQGSQGEMMHSGQPSQAGGSAFGTPASESSPSNDSYMLMVPAFHLPIMPQASHQQPEAPMSSLQEAFTGVYAPSTTRRPNVPVVANPQGPFSMPSPAMPGNQSPLERPLPANVILGNKNGVAGNTEQTQDNIDASAMAVRPIAPAPNRSAPTAGAQAFTTQYASFFAPKQSKDGSVPQDQPTQPAQRPTLKRRNTIDPKTGRPRAGRPRVRDTKKPSTEATQQPQTEQADTIGHSADNQGVATSLNEAE